MTDVEIPSEQLAKMQMLFSAGYDCGATRVLDALMGLADPTGRVPTLEATVPEDVSRWVETVRRTLRND